MLLNTSDYNEIIMSMDLVKLVPITDFINNYMLYAIVNSKDFKDFALGYKSGTTVLHLNKNCFKEYTIKLPNEDILKDLSKVIEVNYKEISQIIQSNSVNLPFQVAISLIQNCYCDELKEFLDIVEMDKFLNNVLEICFENASNELEYNTKNILTNTRKL